MPLNVLDIWCYQPYFLDQSVGDVDDIMSGTFNFPWIILAHILGRADLGVNVN